MLRGLLLYHICAISVRYSSSLCHYLVLKKAKTLALSRARNLLFCSKWLSLKSECERFALCSRVCDVFVKNKKDLYRPPFRPCDWSAGYWGALRLAAVYSSLLLAELFKKVSDLLALIKRAIRSKFVVVFTMLFTAFHPFIPVYPQEQIAPVAL